MQHIKKQLAAINILAFLGILITAYLVFQHYKPAGGSFCNINDYVNCDIVNKSIYADVFGVPVSVIGLAAYMGFFVFSLGVLRKWWPASRLTLGAATLISGGGLLFSLYLTFVEFFWLRAICVMCVTQQIIILIIFMLFFYTWNIERKFRSS